MDGGVVTVWMGVLSQCGWGCCHSVDGGVVTVWMGVLSQCGWGCCHSVDGGVVTVWMGSDEYAVAWSLAYNPLPVCEGQSALSH